MLKQANPANVEAFEILKTRFNRFHNILRQKQNKFTSYEALKSSSMI